MIHSRTNSPYLFWIIAAALILVSCEDNVRRNPDMDVEQETSTDTGASDTSENTNDISQTDVDTETPEEIDEPEEILDPPPDCENLTTPDGCEGRSDCRWLVPGCVDEEDAQILPEAGCYPAENCHETSECTGEDICQQVTIDPCWDTDCHSCAASVNVCDPERHQCNQDPLVGRMMFEPFPSLDIGDSENVVFTGTITYKGPARESNRIYFTHELRLLTEDNTDIKIIYALPHRTELPVMLQGTYTFTFRILQNWDYHALGLVITRPTSGLNPLLFLAEFNGSPFYNIFTGEEHLHAPLSITREEDNNCSTAPDPDCGGVLYFDKLIFDATTGGMENKLELFQGEWGILPIFGDDFLIANIASTHIDPSCPDHPGGTHAFMALRTSENTCDSIGNQDLCNTFAHCSWFVPGCADDSQLAAPHTGCYQIANCSEDTCSTGHSCTEVIINPCANSICGACGAPAEVCLDNTPPVPCWTDEDCSENQYCESEEVCMAPPDCEDGCEPVCYGMCLERP